jgi:ADP-heptose:LPS heptosyltransferase
MRRVLVVHTWGLGDLILATPMMQSLAQSGYSVDLVLFDKNQGVILEKNDFLEHIFYIKRKRELFQFFRKYDVLVTTAGMNPWKVKLLNLFIAAKRLFFSAQVRDMHRIELNLQTVKELLSFESKKPYIYIKQSKRVEEKYLKKDKKNVGLAIGSGSKQKFKRWDKYRELIENLDANLLLFIGPDELELEREYRELDVTIVKESLEDTISLVASLDLVVGNDNGIMHIAYATERNTVTIYGMTNPKESGGYNKNNIALSLEMECMPCFNPANDKIGCKTLECLVNLDSDTVLQKCLQFL